MVRPAHHPPIAGDIHRPTSVDPGYIYGSGGVAGFGSRDYYVAQIPRRQAIDIITANHYAGTVVNNSYVHLGVFLGGNIVGALQFGYALNPHRIAHIVANTGPTEYLELNRMWLDDVAPRNSESQALAYAHRYIRRACPAVRWIQSFADERCGKLGVVYQAANYQYLGSHLTEFFKLDGLPYHRILITAHKKGGVRGAFLRDNIDRATKHRLRQFRYIYFLQRKYMKDLRMRPQPYPKPGEYDGGCAHA